MSNILKKVVLIILDGWGLSPIKEGNATFFAQTPWLFSLLGSCPKITLQASGEAVGLSFGEMGNSEVGHFNIGTGRVVLQDLLRIEKAILDRSFFKNEALLSLISHVKNNSSSLHLLGLVSDGGVHSHINHLFALLEFLAKNKIEDLWIQMITDGRDSPSKKALDYLNKLEEKMKKYKVGKIASISGRYYAMDRDKRWERTEKAYKVLVFGEGEKAENPQEAIKKAYQRGETDEFISPTKILNTKTISKNDGVIFFNFRADRARQLSEALISPEFDHFPRKRLENLFFLSFTSYGGEPIPLSKVAFFPEKVENQLGAILEEKGLSQLHLAETEKYPHITYFFNGGREEPFKNEKRILIPSPKVPTYDLKPEMSAFEITEKALSFIPQFDFSLINFANPDMVGHTGNFQKTVKALEVVDQCLGKILEKALSENITLLITADHGNAECLIDPLTKEVNKEHTTNPVFLILFQGGQKLKKGISQEELTALASLSPAGILADIAPTILEIMDLDKPKEMTGISLLGQLI